MGNLISIPTDKRWCVQQLLEKAKQGDAGAERRVFEYLSVRFTYLAKRRIGEADAEDIAQDACVTVLDKYKAGVHPEAFEAWAYGILRRKIGNYLQSRAVRQRTLVDSEDVETLAGPVTQEVDPVLRRTLIDCLKQMVRAAPRYARVLNLAYQGYRTREICERLRITSNNLYVLLNRGRKMLDDCVNRGGAA